MSDTASELRVSARCPAGPRELRPGGAAGPAGVWVGVALVAAGALAGCWGGGGGGGGGSSSDGGGLMFSMDGGDDADRADGGGEPEDDGGTIDIDPADSGTGGVDAAMDASGTGECTPMTVPEPEPDACSVEDSNCIRDASTQAELTECLNNASTECSGCINDDLLSCATMMGCDTEWGCVVECAMETMCSTTACIQENCPGDLSDLNSCIPPSCATLTEHCLTG